MKIRGVVVGTPIKPEKVLVKSENLTEEEKAIARKNIGIEPTMIVTIDENGKASHTSAEIDNHVKNGGAAVYCDQDGVRYMPISVTQGGVAFERILVNEYGVEQDVVIVDNAHNATIHHEEYRAADEIEDGTESTEKTWSSKKIAREIEVSAEAAIKEAEEAGYKKAVEAFCPEFSKTARFMQCYPISGYPYNVGISTIGDTLVGSVVVCGKNLYDKESYPLDTDGYPYSGASNSGMLTNSNNYKRTDFIPVDHLRGQTITLSHPPSGTNPGISFYKYLPNATNSEDCKTAWCGGTTGATIKVPDYAMYMVFCVNVANANADVQIELGDKTTEYEAYSEKEYNHVEALAGKCELRDGCNTIYATDDSFVVHVECREDISALVRNLQNRI